MFYKHIALLTNFDPRALGRAVLVGGAWPVTGLEHRAGAPAMDLERRDF